MHGDRQATGGRRARRADRRIAFGYVCLDGDGGLGPRKAEIREWCSARGVRLATVVHDRERDGRPSLAWALAQIAGGRAELLVVARLHDLAADVADLPPLLRWFAGPGRDLVALDVQLDTATEAGRLTAAALAGVGGWEQRRAPEPAPRRGGGQGRTAVADVPELHERIAAMRAHGMTLQAIADVLNADGVPTLRGGALWRPSSVQRATGYRRPSSGRGIELPRAGHRTARQQS